MTKQPLLPPKGSPDPITDTVVITRAHSFGQSADELEEEELDMLAEEQSEYKRLKHLESIVNEANDDR